MLDLDADEVLNYAYTFVVTGMDGEARAAFDLALRPYQSTAIADERLPERLRGLNPPSWWNLDHDPLSETITWGG